MVQKKTPEKLGIQAETKKSYVKSDKRSTTHKQSSSNNQDSKNKGSTDLKKKLKKSRSLKLLEFENLESSSLVKEEKSRIKKAPAAVDLCVTPQKSSMVRTAEASPNYMKSTSSSNARTERALVSSSQSSRTSSDSKNLNQNRRNSNSSKSSSPSSEKPMKVLIRRDSLKPVRTLTKSSSMKSTKPSVKKNSAVALNKNIYSGRATCSSTLKDSKFPNYLKIQPGGTESEGKSVMKVCPYTYCSLNGHHHAPVPPLKSFLSARRRSLRTQRSLRLRCLSPVGTKLSAKNKKKIDTGQKEFDEAIMRKCSPPQIEEIGMDFFVEIYAKPREKIDETSNNDVEGRVKLDVTIDLETHADFSSSITDGGETELANHGKTSESIPNEPSYSEMSLEDFFDQSSDFTSTEMDWRNGEIESKLVTDATESPNLTHGDIKGTIESSNEDIVDSDSYGGDLMSEIDVSSDIGGEGSFHSLIEVSSNGDSSVDQKEINQEDTQPDDFNISLISKSVFEEPLGEETGRTEEKIEVCLTEVDYIQVNFLFGDDDISFDDEETYGNTKEEENTYSQHDAPVYEYLSVASPDVSAEAGARLNEPQDEIWKVEDQTLGLVSSETNMNQSPSDINQGQLPLTTDVGVGTEADGQVDRGSGENLHQCNTIQEDSEGIHLGISNSKVVEEQYDPEVHKLNSFATEVVENNQDLELKNEVRTYATEEFLTQNNTIGVREKKTTKYTRESRQQTNKSCSNLEILIRRKEHIEESEEEERPFNPRDPNYLPVQPDPEAEKVDLKQQMIDERKDSEEWMLDYALRKAVNKLAPARKRRVALLVEAFETVAPQPKREIRVQHVMPVFAHTRPMQACI